MKIDLQNNYDKQWSQRTAEDLQFITSAVLPDGNGGFTPCPELMTEAEVIEFLRIPEVSKADNYSNVIENLKRVHGLPRVPLCGKNVYLKEAVIEWLKSRIITGN